MESNPRADFVASVPRRVLELRAALLGVSQDPRSVRARDDLRRRIHAMHGTARVLDLPRTVELLKDVLARLDAARTAGTLSTPDLEAIGRSVDRLSELAESEARVGDSMPPEDTSRFGPHGHDAGGRPAPPSVPRPRVTRGIVDRAHEPAHAPPAPVPVPAPAPPVPEGPRRPLPVSVLVLASDPMARAVEESLPIEVDTAHVSSPDEAVHSLRELTPDLVVAEWDRPADAGELLARLRSEQGLPAVPVIVLSARGDAEAHAGAAARGASEIVDYPLEGADLRAAVERLTAGVLRATVPPPHFGDVSLEELTSALTEEVRRGILGSASVVRDHRIPMGPGSEVLAATWEAIARVRDVIEKRSAGRVRFESALASLGPGGAHVLALGDEEDAGLGAHALPVDDPLPGRRALVVDDDPGVVEFFASLLRGAGMDVIACHDGSNAIVEARRARPDVIISDILMPGVDGFVLCRAIRRDVRLRHVPVILLSWREDLLHRLREAGAGAEGYLRKESRTESILARVRNVLRPRARLVRAIETLREGAELRSRVERIGMLTLLETVAHAQPDSSLSVVDAFAQTELELRGGRLVSVLRTAQDGSLHRGERALLAVLAAGGAKIGLRKSRESVRVNIHRPLEEILASAALHLTALESVISSSSLASIATLELDTDAARVFVGALQPPSRGIAERLMAGTSPATMLARNEATARDIETVLTEFVRRGVIRAVLDAEGDDLVALRVQALRAGETPVLATQSLLDLARKVTGSAPATSQSETVVQVPPAPPTPSFDEPGEPFDASALASADVEPVSALASVELSAPLASTPAPAEEPVEARTDAPVEPAETSRSSASLDVPADEARAAEASSEPSSAEEAPRSPSERPTVVGPEPSLPPASAPPPPSTPPPTSAPASDALESVASDDGAVSLAQALLQELADVPRPRQLPAHTPAPVSEATVETAHAAAPTPLDPSKGVPRAIPRVESRHGVGTATASTSASAFANAQFTEPPPPAPRSGWGRLLLAGALVAGVTYLLVAAYLAHRAPTEPTPAAAPTAQVAEPPSTVPTPTPTPTPVPPTTAEPVRTDTNPVDAAPAAPPPVPSDAAVPAPPAPAPPSTLASAALPPGPAAQDVSADLDPVPFLEGRPLDPSRGLLVVDGLADVLVNDQSAGPAPIRRVLAPVVHTVVCRRGGSQRIHIVRLTAGRATRIVCTVAP